MNSKLFKFNLQKINYFINNDSEREIIAKNGYKRLLKEHTYEHRMKKFLQIVRG